jgi:hypothetical protein
MVETKISATFRPAFEFRQQKSLGPAHQDCIFGKTGARPAAFRPSEFSLVSNVLINSSPAHRKRQAEAIQAI